MEDVKKKVPVDERACVVWHKLSAVAKDKKGNTKTILNNISGFVDPTHMGAIMGPSGCGKTTLLDTLAGRQHSNLEVAGDILVNGKPTKLSYGTVAYVPQEDLLTGTLTVRETLAYTARLRLTLNAQERKVLVEETLAQMGLTIAADAPVGTNFIKGISGGQKRRLSIAQELLVSPSIMFLDEPTSGLDSAAAYFCVSALRGLASHGRSIIMSIHQPSAEVFDLFDKLLLLSRGEMIYFGAAKGAASFYTDVGLTCPADRALADHLIHCMNTDFKKEAADFEASDATAALVAREAKNVVSSRRQVSPEGDLTSIAVLDPESDIVALRQSFETNIRMDLDKQISELIAAGGPKHKGIQNHVNPVTQFFALFQRSVVNGYRDIAVFWIRLAMYVGLCVALGTIYFDLTKSWADVTSRGGLIFFVVSFLTFMSISGFPAFVDEMRVFLRERLNGYYGVAPYTVANSLASVPFLALITVGCSVVVYYLSNLDRDSDKVIYFMLNLFLSLLTVEGLMMAIAAVVPHYLLGLAGGAGLLGIFMPVAGFIIPIDEIPRPVWFYPFHWIGYHTYAFHGMLLNEFKDTGTMWGCPCELDNSCPPGPMCQINGNQVLEALELPLGRSKWVDLAVLLGMTVVFRSFFFFMLKLREAWSK